MFSVILPLDFIKEMVYIHGTIQIYLWFKMAVPKKKTTSSRRNMRRSHDALKGLNISFDKTTGEPKLSHHISLKDGYYDEKQVFVPRSMKRANASTQATEESSEAAAQ